MKENFEIHEENSKYDNPPSSENGNYLLLSMHVIEGIKGYLKKFPILNTKNKIGCSATLIWSGKNGSNTPTEVFNDQPYGFVLDPNLLDVPQADTWAWKSGSEIQDEILKQDAETINNYDYKITKCTTKYPNKKGYYRDCQGGQEFVTNLARNEYSPQKKEAIYHDKGSPDIFAKNIWRKYFKHKKKHFCIENDLMKLNEAIVFQKTKKNPIVGLVIRQKPINLEEAKKLFEILKNNAHLKLYLYYDKARDNIIRVLGNKEAKEYLVSKKNFDAVFQDAQPFKGFPVIDVNNLPGEETCTELKQNFLESYYKKLKKDKGALCGIYGFFVKSHINDNMTLGKIISHAQGKSEKGSGRRSREIVKELGWVLK